MKARKFVVLVLAALVLTTLGIPSRSQAQYGGEDIVLPAVGTTLSYIGCSDVLQDPNNAVRIAIQFTGMNTSATYGKELFLFDLGLATPHQHIIHTQTPGSSSYTFWLSQFEWAYGTDTTATPLPAGPPGGVVKEFRLHLLAGINGPVIKTALIDYNCDTGLVTNSIVIL